MTSHSSTCSPKSLANDQETWPKITGLAALSDDHFNGKNTNIGCIHNSCSIRDKAQRPSAFKSQPSGRLTCSTLELRAQFQPHQRNQKKVTIPAKHVLLPVKSCQNGCGQSLEKQQDCCRGFKLCKSAGQRNG